MGSYSHKAWACPFYRWDEKYKIHCEGCVLAVRDRKALLAYADRFCASVPGWESCPVAHHLVRRYEGAAAQDTG